MARKKSAKRNSGSTGKTPEKPGKELGNNENSDHRRSRRLAVFMQNIILHIYVRLFYETRLNMPCFNLKKTKYY
jgi:hypothetical protein